MLKFQRALYSACQHDHEGVVTRPKLPACSRGAKSLLIKGPPGIGKSALAAVLSAPDGGHGIIARHFCRFDVADTRDAVVWLESMARQILSWAGSIGLEVAPRGMNAVLAVDGDERVVEAWCTLLGAFPRLWDGDPVALVVDSLDEALEADAATIVRAIGAGEDAAPE